MPLRPDHHQAQDLENPVWQTIVQKPRGLNMSPITSHCYSEVAPIPNPPDERARPLNPTPSHATGSNSPTQEAAVQSLQFLMSRQHDPPRVEESPSTDREIDLEIDLYSRGTVLVKDQSLSEPVGKESGCHFLNLVHTHALHL